jgi:tRNA nucleotidyltransferase (CCA-adding enzyme)
MNKKLNIRLRRELFAWERELLAECDLYLVGGTVRDMLLGVSGRSLDEDYVAAGIEFDRLVAILERFGSASLVGRSFGVIKFAPSGGKSADISLPRTEFSTGRGHRDFDVRFDPNIPVEEDLVRRDFTMNSMALHVGSGRLVDPLGGAADVEDRLLRMNGPDSFGEDPLRILRGVQFLARFELELVGKTLERMRRDRELLSTVSNERIREELNKMLTLAEKPSIGFEFMHETGILEFVLPELEETHGVEQNEFHGDDLFTHSIRSCDAARPTLVSRWSALLHDLGKKKMKQVIDGRVVFYRHEAESAEIAGEVLERLLFPGDFTRRVVHLVKHHMFLITDRYSDGAVRRFIARVGKENLGELFELRRADALSRGDMDVEVGLAYMKGRVDAVLESDAAFKREDLAVNGSDVMRILGIEGGRKVGEVLQRLLEMVLENPELNTRDSLTGILKSMK